MQLIAGMCLAFLNCMLSDFPNLGNVDFLIHVALAWLVGLIVFEIAGLYGHRIGAMPAVWAALLFSCYPAGTAALNKPSESSLFTLLVLLAFFSYQRFRLLKEKPYLFAAGVFFALSLTINTIIALVLPLMFTLYELLFRGSPAFLSRIEEGEVTVVTPVSIAARLLLFGSVWLGLTLVLQMALSAKDPASRSSDFSLTIAVFCIFLPLVTLPISGARSRGYAKFISVIGTLLLIATAYGFHNLRGIQCLF